MKRTAAITGIGLLSAHGHNAETVWESLTIAPQPSVDVDRFAPYCIHPLGDVDFSTHIPKRGDLRQMERWQRIGTFTAGLALADAGLVGNQELLDRTDMIVAAGSGERDTQTDMKVLEAISERDDTDVTANEILPSNLRPTLFLAQLSNLLAGNISIVHKVTGGSRTFMGEEMAGVSAIENAVARIGAGQADILLVGGAFNAEREDILLNFELGGMLLQGPHKPVWQRVGKDGGGMAPASAGAFLVIEEKSHAMARGARVYAEIASVVSGRCNRCPGRAIENAKHQFTHIENSVPRQPLAVLSGASGVAPATAEELEFLQYTVGKHREVAIRAYGTVIGHSVEAQFPFGIGLAAMALNHNGMYAPFDESGVEVPFSGSLDQIMVTCWGHWRGEALALVTKAAD